MTGRRLLGFAAAVLLVAACGSSDRTADQAGAPTASVAAGTAADAAAATEVPEILRFQAPLVGGGTYDGAAAAGKVTAYWFWAPT
jgi:hypothetical protein